MWFYAELPLSLRKDLCEVQNLPLSLQIERRLSRLIMEFMLCNKWFMGSVDSVVLRVVTS